MVSKSTGEIFHMLKHLHNEHKEPSRVVILGANGFVGNSVVKYLLASDINVLALTRDDIDLASSNACSKLTRILDSQDSIVFVSARAPVKNNQMLIDNLKMADVVCEALGQTPINHLIYISSDAVYADSEIPLTEESVRGPNSLHGVMHLAREVMLQESIESPMCILRPTLIYGSSDKSFTLTEIFLSSEIFVILTFKVWPIESRSDGLLILE